MSELEQAISRWVNTSADRANVFLTESETAEIVDGMLRLSDVVLAQELVERSWHCTPTAVPYGEIRSGRHTQGGHDA